MGASLFAAVLGAADPRQLLLDAACEQIKANFPRTISHEGVTWLVRVAFGPRGLAVVMLYASPASANPEHSFMLRLGDEFGHVPGASGLAS